MRLPPWVLAAAGAVALAGVAAVDRPGGPESMPRVLAVPAMSLPPAPATDWTDVVRALDAARVAGYADPPSADPSRWADASCACLAVERARLQGLEQAGRALRAVPPVLQEVKVVAVTSDSATVDVTDVLAGYDVIEAGRVVVRFAGRGVLTWRGVLVLRDGEWRWADLLPAGHDRGTGVDHGGPG